MTAYIEQYRIFEMIVDVANTEDIPRAVFTMGDNQKNVFGFKFGTHQMMIRFSPDRTGLWQYSIRAGKKEIEGEFMCIPCSPSNHGPVKTSGMHFEYADGTRFLPFGTTCYAWTYPQENIRWQTLQSLQAAPFNKVRMCLFPKSMIYNEEMPSQYPFLRDNEGLWDMDQPDTEFWKDFENQIQRLDDLGIEADVILFHPYDCWGFAKLTREESLKYLEYCIRRLSPYKNVWWSLGNEYDLMAGKTEEDWEVFAEKILREDVYGHLMSIHHCLKSYPLKPWMTHFSVQTKGTGIALSLSMQNKIPVIIDECGYEGDIEFEWGNLSAFEMVHRFWSVMARGGYCTHGETFYNDAQILWWSKGGRLQGESVRRISFLKELMEQLPGYPRVVMDTVNTDPNGNECHSEDPFTSGLMKLSDEEIMEWMAENLPMLFGNDDYRIRYFGRSCPGWFMAEPLDGRPCRVEVIDIWEMSRTVVCGEMTEKTKISLPGKEGMAVLVSAV